MNQTSGGSNEVGIVAITISPKERGLEVEGAGKQDGVPKELANGMEIAVGDCELKANDMLEIKGQMKKLPNGSYVNVKEMQKLRKTSYIIKKTKAKVVKRSSKEMEM